MLKLVVFSVLFSLSTQATDFENARIVGLPRLICSKKSITFNFETNIPFQGRISIMKKMYIPECNQDFAVNINRNASFKLDIGRCTDTTYTTNGSRVLAAHVEIGFHPLVITSSDRVYAIQCIDNSYAVVRPKSRPEPYNCSHVVRMAARWEGVTSFHVGDSVVHEWSCAMAQNDIGKLQTFLTSCNAISQAGQIIHLIDENGCIVDSELMGELVYNSYMPKIYARAKMFKLMNGEKYRIECILQMCRKGGACSNRPFPPKCAFTKDEILNRFEAKPKDNSPDDSLMAGSINMGFESHVRVSSEWITVHYNQYTNVEQLHERYFITSLMNPRLNDEHSTTQKHFLMSISYREPSKNMSSTEQIIEEQQPLTTSKLRTNSVRSFKPLFSPEISSSSSEENSIETITAGLATIAPQFPTEDYAETDDQQPESTTSVDLPPSYTPRTVQRTTARPTTTPSYTITSATIPVTSSRRLATVPRTTHRSTTTPTTTTQMPSTSTTIETVIRREPQREIMHFEKATKTTSKGKIATMKFYTDQQETLRAAHRLTPTTPYPQLVLSTTEIPFEDNKVFSPDFKFTSTTSEPEDEPVVGNEIKEGTKEKFANPRDWRLDDRTINDTDIFSDRQVSCGNTTVIASESKCGWSGLEQLMMVWSLGSILVWTVMLCVCCYRQSKAKPSWAEYRERELQRVTQSRVLQQEHPWIHADAFEEPKIRNKHEIDMSKF